MPMQMSIIIYIKANYIQTVNVYLFTEYQEKMVHVKSSTKSTTTTTTKTRLFTNKFPSPISKHRSKRVLNNVVLKLKSAFAVFKIPSLSHIIRHTHTHTKNAL